MPKVFSIEDFRRGLDTRRSPLAAPPATLRILENAVITPGGEIQKRFAFVRAGTITPNPWAMIGQFQTLHVFGCPSAPSVAGVQMPPGTTIVPHALAALPGGATVVSYLDVETYGDDGFYVCARGSDGLVYNWWNGALVYEANNTTPARGTYARTYKTKMYRTQGFDLYFSGVNDPAENDPADVDNPGAGFIEIAKNDPEAEPGLGLEVFFDRMAVFSRLATQLWTLDPDPANDKLEQVIRIGSVAAQSVQQYGTGDVLFLSDSGVRSLRASSVSGFATSNDVGAAIDLILMPIVRFSDDATQAVSMIQPSFGRYWLAIKNTIYILNYFPAAEITAWSTFILDFDVRQFSTVANNIAVADTSGNLYWYGGLTRQDYDSARVRVRTPHHDNKAPTENKRIKSVDVLCEGAWSVSLGMLPNNLDAYEPAANITGNTFGLYSIPFAGYGTHVSVQLEHAAPGAATLAAIHLNILEGVTK